MNSALLRSERYGRLDSGRDAMATLDATALDDGPSGAGAHARAEAVLTLTTAYIRLISAFHNRKSRSGEFAVGDRL